MSEQPLPPTIRTPAPGGPPAPLPPKPAEVAEYERIGEQGGWHDGLGFLLVLAAGAGCAWAYWTGRPRGYGLGGLAAVLGVWVWVAGYRLGDRKRRGAEAAHAYIRELRRAQAAGTATPELSPALRPPVAPPTTPSADRIRRRPPGRGRP